MKFDKNQKIRLLIVLIPPIGIFFILFLSSFYYLKVPPPLDEVSPMLEKSPHQQASSAKTEVRSNFKTLVSSALGIPVAELEYEACLVNQNKTSLTLFGADFDPHALSSDADQIGGMEVKFLGGKEPVKSVYARMGSSTCIRLSEDDISSGKVAIQSRIIVVSSLTINGVLQTFPTTTSQTDTSGSKLYAYMIPSNAFLMFLFLLAGWSGVVLLVNGVIKFILHAENVENETGKGKRRKKRKGKGEGKRGQPPLID